MKQAMALLEPELKARRQAARSRPGTVVIGTVRGDIHEIGKSLVATMLSANGFEVHDLGVDVSVERIRRRRCSETGANLVGLSALLTTTMNGQRKVIEALERGRAARPGEGDGGRRAGEPEVGRGDRRRRLRARTPSAPWNWRGS